MNPNFYAVIPASVRYDKKLNFGTRLLYGEITALCNEKGYCWATNDYFSKLYDVSEATISIWIKGLHDAGHIVNKVEKSAAGTTRKIFLSTGGVLENSNTGDLENSNGGLSKNLKHNTTVNNTNNNKRTGAASPGYFDIELPFKSESFKNKWAEWLKFRKEKRVSKYTETGLKHTFKNLLELSGNVESVAIGIINQSMSNNWQGLFKLKNEIKKSVPQSDYLQQLENQRRTYKVISEQ